MSSISAISGSSANLYASSSSSVPSNAQIQSDLQSLSGALQSGNLTQAQGAFATLQKDAPNLVQASGTTSSNPVSSALSAVGTALNQGNLSAAQTAFASLKQTARAHHHHHHHGGSVAVTASPAASGGSSSSTASLLNVTA